MRLDANDLAALGLDLCDASALKSLVRFSLLALPLPSPCCSALPGQARTGCLLAAHLRAVARGLLVLLDARLIDDGAGACANNAAARQHAARQAEAPGRQRQLLRKKRRPPGDAPTATWSYLGNTQP